MWKSILNQVYPLKRLTDGYMKRLYGMGESRAPLNYEGFPKSVCTSVNEVVCHGIPDEEQILKEGDIINVDVSTIYNGYYSDSFQNVLHR